MPRCALPRSRRHGDGSVVHEVARGEADAGGTYPHVGPDGSLLVAGWYPYAGAGGMRALSITGPICADVIALVRARAPACSVSRARSSCACTDAAELLEDPFGADRLVAARTTDYDAVRVAIR